MGIREIRRAKNITQQELADRIGVNHTMISRYESGQVQPSMDKIILIAQVLGESIESIEAELPPRIAYISYPRPLRLSNKKGASRLGPKHIECILSRANGKCELCGLPAPFIDFNGKPYLEISRIDPTPFNEESFLSNYVALCPNCNRKVARLRQPEDIEKLRLYVASHDVNFGL